jgi:Ribbon-helix-helix protein, copG family
MKIKTSVSLEEKDLEKIKAIARREDRPYSWVLQKLVRIAVNTCGQDTETFCKKIKELANAK